MELHQAFNDWLAAGAEGEPARDLAVHASGCSACMRAAAAMESLLAVDVGEAPLPPMRIGSSDADAPSHVARYGALAAAVVLLGVFAVIGGLGILRPAEPASSAVASDSPGEDVLAGEPSETPETESPTRSPTSTPSTSPTSTESPATAAPTQRPQPPQPTIPPAPPPPPPTDAPTPEPTVAPTLLPSPTPTATPTATPDLPTPTPTSSELEPTPTPTVP